MTGSDEQHLITREQVVNFLTVHAETFVPPEFYAAEYVERMAIFSTWATDAQIRATATFLQTYICFHRSFYFTREIVALDVVYTRFLMAISIATTVQSH